MNKEKDSFWKRIRYKYRLSVMNEDTLTESWHVRLSKLGVFMVLTLMFVLTIALFGVLIIYTPIRNVLPGYSESLRQQIIQQTNAVDSLSTTVELHRQYIDIVKQVVMGEVSTDTVQSLDSMQLVMREQLLEAKNEVTAEFIAQYEANQKDNLQLFDIRQTAPTTTFFRPVKGVVVEKYNPERGRLGVDIRCLKDEPVSAVLAGTLVYVNYEIDNTYTMMVQHTQYISIYSHVERTAKHVGDVVQAGDCIAVADESKMMHFELWQNGKSVNPEEVIAF